MDIFDGKMICPPSAHLGNKALCWHLRVGLEALKDEPNGLLQVTLCVCLAVSKYFKSLSVIGAPQPQPCFGVPALAAEKHTHLVSGYPHSRR